MTLADGPRICPEPAILGDAPAIAAQPTPAGVGHPADAEVTGAASAIDGGDLMV